VKEQRLKVAISAGLISLGMVGTADAALVSRLGGLAYYDDVANLTWLADTNPVNGTAFNYGFTNDGSTARGLNISRSGTANAGSQSSKLVNLFYNVLGNVSDYDSSGVFDNGCVGSCLTSTGPFSNVQLLLLLVRYGVRA